MSSILEALGFGAGSGVASAGIGYMANRALAQEQQKYYQKNLAKQFAYSQLAQKLAPTNIKQGLVMAGMSPALASEGHFSPAQSPTAPLGSNSVGMPNVNVAESALAVAQAKKSDAEAEALNIRNAQERNADEVSNLLSDVYFKKLSEVARSSEEKAMYDNLVSVAKNKGAFGLFSEFLNILDKKELYDASYQEYLLRKNVAWLQNHQDADLKAIANMPVKNLALLDKTLEKYTAEIENLNKQKELTEEEKNLKLSQIKLTDAEIANLKEVTQNLKNTNVMKMIDAGDYGKAFMATILMLLGNISGSVTHKF